MPAVLAIGGVDPAYWFKARWPDEIAIIEALAVEIRETLKQHREDQAVRVANHVGEMLDKSFGG